MKAIIKNQAGPGLELVEVPKPQPKKNEVLIRVKKVSICGTDVSIYKWSKWAEKNVKPGTIIGHEFVGEIAELGEGVTQFHVGQRVSAEGHITCGTCRSCMTGKRHLCPNTSGFGYHQDGCFAEFFTVPSENVFPLSDSISDDIAAILDPLGNAVHTALSFSLTSEDVLITGAGPIGIMAAAVAKHAGAKTIAITDVNEYRLDLAKKMGATHTLKVDEIDPSTIKDLGYFSVGLEMSGFPDGLNTLLESLQPGAKIGLLGVLPPGTTIDWDLVIFKLLEMKGIWGREIFGTWYQMQNMLESGLNVDPVITHHFSVEDYQKGFDVMLSGQSGKVILEW